MSFSRAASQAREIAQLTKTLSAKEASNTTAAPTQNGAAQANGNGVAVDAANPLKILQSAIDNLRQDLGLDPSSAVAYFPSADPDSDFRDIDLRVLVPKLSASDYHSRYRAMYAIRELSTGGGFDVMRIVEEEALDSIVAQTLAPQKDVKIMAGQTLTNLARYPLVRIKLGRRGAVGALGSILKTQDNDGVRAPAVMALANLLTNCPENVCAAQRSDVHSALLQVLRSSKDEMVKYHCVRMLVRLYKDNYSPLMQEGGPDLADPLLKLSRDGDDWCRGYAKAALAFISEKLMWERRLAQAAYLPQDAGQSDLAKVVDQQSAVKVPAPVKTSVAAAPGKAAAAPAAAAAAPAAPRIVSLASLKGYELPGTIRELDDLDGQFLADMPASDVGSDIVPRSESYVSLGGYDTPMSRMSSFGGGAVEPEIVTQIQDRLNAKQGFPDEWVRKLVKLADPKKSDLDSVEAAMALLLRVIRERPQLRRWVFTAQGNERLLSLLSVNHVNIVATTCAVLAAAPKANELAVYHLLRLLNSQEEVIIIQACGALATHVRGYKKVQDEIYNGPGMARLMELMTSPPSPEVRTAAVGSTSAVMWGRQKITLWMATRKNMLLPYGELLLADKKEVAAKAKAVLVAVADAMAKRKGAAPLHRTDVASTAGGVHALHALLAYGEDSQKAQAVWVTQYVADKSTDATVTAVAKQVLTEAGVPPTA